MEHVPAADGIVSAIEKMEPIAVHDAHRIVDGAVFIRSLCNHKRTCERVAAILRTIEQNVHPCPVALCRARLTVEQDRAPREVTTIPGIR